MQAQLLRRFFAPEYLVKKEHRLGELPSGRDAYRDVIRIALPSIAEMVLMSLIGSVDTMMVGGLGPQAISAVSLASQPRFLFMNLIMALNTGATAVISRARGMQDQQRANAILRQNMVFITFIAIFSTIVGFTLSEPLIRFMANGGLDDDVVREGAVYLRIQFAFSRCWPGPPGSPPV